MRHAFLALCALCAGSTGWSGLANADANSPYGLWLTEKKGVMVNVYDCDSALCARTVWLKKPFRSDGSVRLDRENPNPALRNRPWCGMEVITGVKPDGPNEWEKGKIYDPKTGSTFDVDMKIKDGQMRVRGYLGSPLVGKSEKWSRPDPSIKPGCITSS